LSHRKRNTSAVFVVAISNLDWNFECGGTIHATPAAAKLAGGVNPPVHFACRDFKPQSAAKPRQRQNEKGPAVARRPFELQMV